MDRCDQNYRLTFFLVCWTCILVWIYREQNLNNRNVIYWAFYTFGAPLNYGALWNGPCRPSLYHVRRSISTEDIHIHCSDSTNLLYKSKCWSGRIDLSSVATVLKLANAHLMGCACIVRVCLWQIICRDGSLPNIETAPQQFCGKMFVLQQEKTISSWDELNTKKLVQFSKIF